MADEKNDLYQPNMELATVTAGERGLQLGTLADMQTAAKLILQSGLAPSGYKSTAQVFVGLQTGAEIGLKPMQSLNSIAVIQGKPTLWGDAALALVRKSGFLEDFDEYFEINGERVKEKDLQYVNLAQVPDKLIAVCFSKRRGYNESTHYFSVADAKLAKLWGKAGTWQTHYKRMLKYKARAFNLRDNYSDVTFGLHLTEEIEGEVLKTEYTNDIPKRGDRIAGQTTVTSKQIESQEVGEAGNPQLVAAMLKGCIQKFLDAYKGSEHASPLDAFTIFASEVTGISPLEYIGGDGKIDPAMFNEVALQEINGALDGWDGTMPQEAPLDEAGAFEEADPSDSTNEAQIKAPEPEKASPQASSDKWYCNGCRKPFAVPKPGGKCPRCLSTKIVKKEQ